MSTQVSQKSKIVSSDTFRDEVVSGVQAGLSQSQFAKAWAAKYGQSEATAKQRYHDLVSRFRSAIETAEKNAAEAEEGEIKTNHLNSLVRLNKALGVLSFVDGRKKENGGGLGKGRKKEDVVLDMTAWLEEKGLLKDDDSEEAAVTTAEAAI